MKLAFCLFRYFPFGGLQRDFMRIAEACQHRGHEVKVFTGAWEGKRQKDLPVEILPVSGWQNHTRSRSFAKLLRERLTQEPFDRIVGFNKMPGLDLYYAADVCTESRIKTQRPFWYRFLPRYRQYLQDERAVFSKESRTHVLVLSAAQREEYHRCHGLPLDQFHLLPPGISRDRLVSENADARRAEIREEQHLNPDEKVLLLVGSGFKTKGLDRILLGLAALPEALRQKTRLWIVGQDNASPFWRLAKQLHVDQHLTFLGGRHDVTRYFQAADLLVHPAYHENTGTVLLEAMAAGLPVLTLDVCGYAPFIRTANAGEVLPSPFDQSQFNQRLENMLNSPRLQEWRQNGLTFARSADIYSLPEKAAQLIETLQ